MHASLGRVSWQDASQLIFHQLLPESWWLWSLSRSHRQGCPSPSQFERCVMMRRQSLSPADFKKCQDIGWTFHFWVKWQKKVYLSVVPLLHGRFEVTISPYPEILSGHLQFQAEPGEMHYLSTQRSLSKFEIIPFFPLYFKQNNKERTPWVSCGSQAPMFYTGLCNRSLNPPAFCTPQIPSLWRR